MGVRQDHMNVHGPTWRYDWNLNSVGILVGIAATIAGWGYVVGGVNGDIEDLVEKNAKLQAEVSRIENETRRFERLEFRVEAVESRATSAADTLRTVEAAINNLMSDMRLVRQIVERLERSQNGGRSYESPTPFRGTEP